MPELGTRRTPFLVDHQGVERLWRALQTVPSSRPQVRVRMGPSGVHIFDRTSGLNVLFDELRVDPALWAAAPRHVSVALTNACDLKCPHCFAPKHRASLVMERLTGWLDELDANGCLGVGFGGGEPTLYPGLTELCHYVTMKTKMAATLTTNAHLLDDKLNAALSGNVQFIRVSMDGVGATYESIRGRSFEALERRLKDLVQLAPLGINFLVNDKTLPDLGAAVQIANDVGAGEILLLPERPTRQNSGIDRGTAQTLREWVARYKGRVRLTISESAAEGFPVCNPFDSEPGLATYAHIDADGVLKRTSFDTSGVPIGPGGFMQALAKLRRNSKEGEV
ncbi:MAG: radical SAM protein [Symbiobacteriia bacterium]